MNIIDIIEADPTILRNREKLKALFYHAAPIKAKANLAMMGYDGEILERMKMCYPLDENLQQDFIITLCEDFCIPKEKATYVVKLWMKIITPDIAHYYGFKENDKLMKCREKETNSDILNKCAMTGPAKSRTEWVEEYSDAVVIFCGKKEYGAFNNDGIVLNWLVNCRIGVKEKDTFATYPRLDYLEEVLNLRQVSYIVIEKGFKIKEMLYPDNQYSVFLERAIKVSKADYNRTQESERKEEKIIPSTIPGDTTQQKNHQTLNVNSDETIHKCKDCMLYRNETCFGSKEICEDFRFAPTIPKEEMDLWPKMGDASFYRMGGRYR
ncbi:MAG: hypothetical protein MSA45_08060 [Firmicutes bacterium]|nr:hypothetical protein [Bacillota bacterium]